MPESPGASRPASLRFTLACDLKQVRQATQSAHQFLAEHGCAEETLTACDLALVEACNNAIKYAPTSARTQPVIVEVLCEPAALELRITDHTPGFDWPERVELPAPESESGRGIFLIQTLMDSASYLCGKGQNILILRKSRPAEAKTDVSKNGHDDWLVENLLDELSACYESLSAIFRYSAEPDKPGDLRKFARRLLGDLSAVVGADWYAFRVVQNQSRLDVLTVSESALDMGPIIFRGEIYDADFLEAQAAISQKPIRFDETHVFAMDDPLRQKPRSRGFIYPVFVGGNFVGTLAMGKNPGTAAVPGDFTARHRGVIAGFAQFLGIQIVNSRAQEQHIANRIIAHELEIAGSIQRSLLLKELPQLPGFELAALCRSAHHVGGDFYDVLKLSNDTALLVIADVMGKGVLAAMFAAILRAVLRATPELNRRPAELLARVNQLLFDELSGVDMFITAQLAFVDTKGRKLIVGNAGHCPLLVTDGFGLKCLSPEGMPLGILPEAVFANETVDLPQNCSVLLYTDGITEAMGASGERYGQDRLTNWFRETQSRPRPARELQHELANQLTQFQWKTGLNDDQTFLIMTG